jgi:hypothetical protein
MDLTRFKECCAAFGAERRRWPGHEHALYDRFAGTSEGAAILAEAERIDSFLDTVEPARPDVHRLHLIGVRAKPVWQRLSFSVAALAACAALGFIVGSLQSSDAADVGSVAELLLGPQSLREFGL